MANGFYEKIAQFQVAEDKENVVHSNPRSSPKPAPVVSRDINVDSGYHEMSDDDQENVKPAHPAKQGQMLASKSPDRSTTANIPSPPRLRALKQLQTTQQDSDASFHSAIGSPNTVLAEDVATQDKNVMLEQDELQVGQQTTQKAIIPPGLQQRTSHQFSVSTTVADGLDAALDEVERTAPSRLAKSRSSSETSSPERPVIRKKSSLTFASLPARDPLSLKMSIGPRASQNRGSIRGPPALHENTIAKAAPIPKASKERDEDARVTAELKSIETVPIQQEVQSDPSKVHSKTSTQRLHERITMLGQMKQARPSKSIPSMPANNQSQSNHENPHAHKQIGGSTTEEVDDDWIAPISGRTTQSSQTMPGSFSTTSGQWFNQTQESTLIEPVVPELQPPAGKDQTLAQNYPRLPVPVEESNTPAGSPVASKWQVDGPLSASKARFSSFLKSAKGIFASSAAASAQAKAETLSPGRSKVRVDLEHTDMFQPPKELGQSSVNATHDGTRAAKTEAHDDARHVSQSGDGNKRRSSQRLRQQKEAEDADMNEAIDVETDIRAENSPPLVSADVANPSASESREQQAQRMVVEEQRHNMAQKKPKAFAGNASQSGELRRPNKITKNQTGPAKGSFSIRVPSQKVVKTNPLSGLLC